MGFLKVQHQIQPLSVKVVMDKATGRSKSFGFVNFETVSDAEDFLNAK
jgi:RNA recognition motif-containing protein